MPDGMNRVTIGSPKSDFIGIPFSNLQSCIIQSLSTKIPDVNEIPDRGVSYNNPGITNFNKINYILN